MIPTSLATLALLAAGQATAADTIIVTATRAPKPIEEIGRSVTVLDRTEIDVRQEPILSDLLATTPGVTVSRNGGPGTTTTLRIRGAESDQTVVLIDGVKLNDPSSPGGGFNFANLLSANIARVEVLRGPQSTLWGSQAIGGVVNIVTNQPEIRFGGDVRLEGGARGTGLGTAYVSGRSGRASLVLGAGYYRTDGISAFDEEFGGRERDGYRQVGGYAKLGYALSDDVDIEVRGLISEGRAEIDGFPAPRFALADTDEYGKTREVVGYAGLNAVLLDGRFRNRIGVAYTGTNRDGFNPAAAVVRTFDAKGENVRLEYQGGFTVTDGAAFLFGAETERSELSTASPTAAVPNPTPLVADVRLNSVYALVDLKPVAGLSLSAGIRRDDQSNFDGATTRSASLAYTPNGGTTMIRASFGEGFKAPTLYQLFSEYGNRALRPEEADGWDAGIEQALVGGDLRLALTYFGRRTRNQIDFVSCFRNADPRCQARPGGFYDNIARTSAEGIELGLSLRASNLVRLSANYTLTDTENRTPGANLGRALPRRARETANTTVAVTPAAGLELSTTISLIGDSFDNASNTTRLDGYTLVDIRASYRLSERLELFGRIENLFDADYQTVFRYGQPGRGAFVGARANF